MLKKIYPFCLGIILLTFIFSCAGLSEEFPSPIAESEIVQETFEKPKPSTNIMERGIIPVEKMALFLLNNNPQENFNYILALANFYVEEAALEGVNHDIAFAQMSLETGFLRFGNLVTPDQYNFAGLGATGLPDKNGIPDKGMYFPDPRTGVRAHIQHLKAYATDEPLNLELVNPRRRFVRLGSSPTIEGLAGTWAADRQYAVKINTILERLYDFSFL